MIQFNVIYLVFVAKCRKKNQFFSMTQTCERFQTEWDMLNKNMQSQNNVGTSDGSSSTGKKRSKRRSSGNVSEDTKQSKKQKSMPFNSSNA